MSGWTKRQFINAAYEEIGLGQYAFDLAPEQLISACRRLDAMMAEWNGKGIRLGYPIVEPTLVVLDEQTNVPDSANEAIFTNLAIRLAPTVGRTPQPETKRTARAALLVLYSRAGMPPEMQLPDTMPAGAGNKPWRYDNPFLNPPDDPIEVGPDGVLSYD